MRLIHTSDWHLGKTLFEHSLLEEQSRFLDWLIILMREERADALIISGDIYHRSVPPAEAVELLDSFLSRAVLELKIPVLSVAGNHDSGARLEFAGALLKAAGYHVAGRPRRDIATLRLEDEHGSVCFWLLPYLFPADVRVLLPESGARTFDTAYGALLGENLSRADKGIRNVAVCHGFFAGSEPVIESESELSVGGMDAVSASLLDFFDYAALGHLHAPQRVSKRARYSGSPLKYSLSEEKQRKSVALVELSEPGSPAVIREIPVPARRDVRRISGSFNRLMEPSEHLNKSFEDYVFAEITDSGVLYPVEKLRTLFPNLLGVSFPAQQQSGEAPMIGRRREQLSTEAQFLRFYSDTAGKEIPPVQLAILREILNRIDAKDREAVLP